jgi:hypothetical protein
LYLLAQKEAVKPATPGQPIKEATEAALRERVKSFYDLQVDGKFRQTEAIVCPESREAYYALPKSKPFSAEIASVKLAEDLRSATVSEAIEQNQSLGGLEQKVKMPAVSHWNLVEEQWCYYMLPASSVADSPFGKMDFSGGTSNATGTNSSGVTPDIKPQSLPPDARLVSFSKLGVRLPFEVDGSDEIVVTNSLPGPVQFRVVCPNVPGLVCRFDQTMLKAGAETRFHVNFRFKETPLTAGQAVQVWIEPFDKLVSIPIAKLEATRPQ